MNVKLHTASNEILMCLAAEHLTKNDPSTAEKDMQRNSSKMNGSRAVMSFGVYMSGGFVEQPTEKEGTSGAESDST